MLINGLIRRWNDRMKVTFLQDDLEKTFAHRNFETDASLLMKIIRENEYCWSIIRDDYYYSFLGQLNSIIKTRKIVETSSGLSIR